jgi:Flp pilus assembly protein TadG
MTPVRRLLRRLTGDRRGSILAETAVTISVLAMVSLAGVEVGRYTLLHQKMERVAASIGDLIAQAPTLSETDVDNVFAAIGEVAKPFEMGPNGLVIISSISLDSGGNPQITWQRTDGGLSGSSAVGASGGPATLPAGLTVEAGDTVIREP